LCSGLTRGEHRGAFDSRRERSVIEAIEVGPGQRTAFVQAEVVADLGCDRGVVAGDHLDRDPQVGQPAQGLCGVQLGRVEEHQQSHQAKVALILSGRWARVLRDPGGYGNDTVASRELGIQRLARLRWDVDAAVQDRLGGPLRDQGQPALGVADEDGVHASFVVERQDPQPGVVGHRGSLAGRGRGVPQRLVQRVPSDGVPVPDGALGAEQSPAKHLVGRAVAGRHGPHEADSALGQRAGLVGEQHIDVAEILDADQPLDQNLAAAHPARSGGQACGHHCR